MLMSVRGRLRLGGMPGACGWGACFALPSVVDGRARDDCCPMEHDGFPYGVAVPDGGCCSGPLPWLLLLAGNVNIEPPMPVGGLDAGTRTRG